MINLLVNRRHAFAYVVIAATTPLGSFVSVAETLMHDASWARDFNLILDCRAASAVDARMLEVLKLVRMLECLDPLPATRMALIGELGSVALPVIERRFPDCVSAWFTSDTDAYRFVKGKPCHDRSVV